MRFSEEKFVIFFGLLQTSFINDFLIKFGFLRGREIDGYVAYLLLSNKEIRFVPYWENNFIGPNLYILEFISQLVGNFSKIILGKVGFKIGRKESLFDYFGFECVRSNFEFYC